MPRFISNRACSVTGLSAKRGWRTDRLDLETDSSAAAIRDSVQAIEVTGLHVLIGRRQ